MNVSDSVQVEKNSIKIKFIGTLVSENPEIRIRRKIAYDEDFCLFKDFPFQQLIILKSFDFTLTCPILWLYRNYNLIYNNLKKYKWLQTNKRNSTNDKCDF